MHLTRHDDSCPQWAIMQLSILLMYLHEVYATIAALYPRPTLDAAQARLTGTHPTADFTFRPIPTTTCYRPNPFTFSVGITGAYMAR